MVIKLAYDTVPHIRKVRKRHAYYIPVTQPGRGQQKKVLNKWTDLKRVFNRETYTNWFGNSRFILLVNIEKINKWKHAWRNNRIRPWGFRMVRTRQRDVVPVFNNMGLKPLSNALRSSHALPTMIVYAYGNELSPIGNPESLPLIKRIINEFHNNKKKEHDYIIAGALDRRVLTQREIVDLLNFEDPQEYCKTLGSHLQPHSHIPSMLQLHQMQLTNCLDFVGKQDDQQTSDSSTTSDASNQTEVQEKTETQTQSEDEQKVEKSDVTE